jgi:hypothetical protein
MIKIARKTLFLSIAEDEIENKKLESLCGETRYFCLAFKKTGLRIVIDYKADGKNVAVFSLNDPVHLSEEDIAYLKDIIQETRQNHEAKIQKHDIHR